LKYADPTGHFEENQIRDALSDLLTEPVVDEVIANWQAYYADWWALLTEAEYGDMIDGVISWGIGSSQRRIGQFYQGDDGRVKLRGFVTNEDELHLNLNGEELISSGKAGLCTENVSLLNWFGLGSKRGAGEVHTSDIILSRQRHEGGKYYARAGTGSYFDPAGGIAEVNPNPLDGGLGVLEVAAGSFFFLRGSAEILSGVLAPAGLFETALGAAGVYDGSRRATGYWSQNRAALRVDSYP